MPLSRTTRKRLVWGTAGVVLVLLLAIAFRPSPVTVETGEVTRGPMELTIDADGVTRVVDRYQVAAPVSGMLRRIELVEGDPVEVGSVLARITPLPLDPQAASRARAAVAAAEARVAEANDRVIQARGTMEQLQRTAERVRTVVREGGMSVEAGERAELEAANAAREYSAAQARVAAATSDLAAARAALEDADGGGAAANVVAPAGGRVLRVHERSDRVVPAGTPLLDVGDARALEVVVDVLSTDAVRIPAGTPLRIEEWGGEEVIHGRVRSVEPSAFTRISTLGVEEQRVNVIGELVGVPATLGDRYRIEARIVVWQSADVLRVPSSALFREDDRWRVFLVEGGRSRLREVEIGQRGVAHTEVLSGLREEDLVVLFPPEEIDDGTRVRAE